MTSTFSWAHFIQVLACPASIKVHQAQCCRTADHGHRNNQPAVGSFPQEATLWYRCQRRRSSSTSCSWGWITPRPQRGPPFLARPAPPRRRRRPLHGCGAHCLDAGRGRGLSPVDAPPRRARARGGPKKGSSGDGRRAGIGCCCCPTLCDPRFIHEGVPGQGGQPRRGRSVKGGGSNDSTERDRSLTGKCGPRAHVGVVLLGHSLGPRILNNSNPDIYCCLSNQMCILCTLNILS